LAPRATQNTAGCSFVTPAHPPPCRSIPVTMLLGLAMLIQAYTKDTHIYIYIYIYIYTYEEIYLEQFIAAV